MRRQASFPTETGRSRTEPNRDRKELVESRTETGRSSFPTAAPRGAKIIRKELPRCSPAAAPLQRRVPRYALLAPSPSPRMTTTRAHGKISFGAVFAPTSHPS